MACGEGVVNCHSGRGDGRTRREAPAALKDEASGVKTPEEVEQFAAGLKPRPSVFLTSGRGNQKRRQNAPRLRSGQAGATKGERAYEGRDGAAGRGIEPVKDCRKKEALCCFLGFCFS